jgi:hypothetical protein
LNTIGKKLDTDEKIERGRAMLNNLLPYLKRLVENKELDYKIRTKFLVEQLEELRQRMWMSKKDAADYQVILY